MITRESLKLEIDVLPDEALPILKEFILFQKFQLGILDDTEYLSSREK